MTLLYADASRGTARFVVALVFGLWVLRVAWFPLADLAELPWGVARPVFPLGQLPGSVIRQLQQPEGLRALQLVTLGCLLPAAFGVGLRWSGLASCVLLTVRESIPRSFGHVNHAEIPLLLSAYALTLLAWADEVQKRSGRTTLEWNPHAGPPLAVLTILLLSYAMTGLFRVTHGFPDVFTTDAMTFWAASCGWADSEFAFGYGRHAGAAPAMSFALDAGLVAVTVVEVAAPFVLASWWCRAAVLAVLLPFHVGTLQIMNIFFPENFLLLLLLFDAGRVFGRRAEPESDTPNL